MLNTSDFKVAADFVVNLESYFTLLVIKTEVVYHEKTASPRSGLMIPVANVKADYNCKLC